MSQLFGVGILAISKHLKNIFTEGELDENVVVSKMETTTQHGAIAGKTQTREVVFITLMPSSPLAIALIPIKQRVSDNGQQKFFTSTFKPERSQLCWCWCRAMLAVSYDTISELKKARGFMTSGF